MQTKAAFLTKPGEDWRIDELTLDPPRGHEVLIRYSASGLCHSDEHLRTEGFWAGTARFPMVGGHEGAGVVMDVGEGVSRVAPGDHVVCSFIPSCGVCRWCATGHQNLCDVGANTMTGSQLDGTFRFHLGQQDFGALCMLGTFSEYGVISEYSCVRVDDDLPLKTIALTGCGVPTGWGSAVYAAGVEAGDTIAIFGVGGVGMNAVQGAAYAGAKYVVAVDPVELKRNSALDFGATHAVADAELATSLVTELTRGVGADKALVTAGVVDREIISNAFNLVRKGGTLVITGLAPLDDLSIQLNSTNLTSFSKTIKGALFGSGNPTFDIPKVLGLYRTGHIKLDELVTKRYQLEQVNDGYADMLDGKIIRGLIEFNWDA